MATSTLTNATVVTNASSSSSSSAAGAVVRAVVSHAAVDGEQRLMKLHKLITARVATQLVSEGRRRAVGARGDECAHVGVLTLDHVLHRLPERR